jgi:hypothetical protein
MNLLKNTIYLLSLLFVTNSIAGEPVRTKKIVCENSKCREEVEFEVTTVVKKTEAREFTVGKCFVRLSSKPVEYYKVYENNGKRLKMIMERDNKRAVLHNIKTFIRRDRVKKYDDLKEFPCNQTPKLGNLDFLNKYFSKKKSKSYYKSTDY